MAVVALEFDARVLPVGDDFEKFFLFISGHPCRVPLGFICSAGSGPFVA